MSDAYWSRGNVYFFGLKNYDKAITDYTRSMELNPKDPRAYESRANAYEARGEQEKARADRKKHEELTRAKSGQ
jgi:tetratricopeptide (TPR) repeat protein